MQNMAKRLSAQLFRSRVAMGLLLLPLGVAGMGLMDYLQPALRLVYILLGFSLIIFLHELGHFVVARLCSVKCLAFSIGIGPRMCGWRKHGGFSFGADPWDPESGKRSHVATETAAVQSDLPTAAKVPPHPGAVGDTDYRVSWLPLGGYVRMLGQDDMDPTKVSEDPNSFNRRPIWQRMCIVSAGVIMNIIFAAVAFSVIFSPGIGVDFPPAVIGPVYYGMPAEGQLHLGDRVLQVDDKQPRGFLEFTDLLMEGALSSGNDKLHLLVRRYKTGKEETVDLLPKRSDVTGFLAIGVESIPGVKMAGGGDDAVAVTKSKDQKAPAWVDQNAAEMAKIKDGDKIVAVDGKELPAYQPDVNPDVHPYIELYDLLQQAGDRPVKLTLENTKDKSHPRQEITIYPHVEFMPGLKAFPAVFGLAPCMMVAGVSGGDPAESAGIKAGDIIARAGARAYPSVDEFVSIVNDDRNGEPMDIWVDRPPPIPAAPAATASPATAAASQPVVSTQLVKFSIKPKNVKGKGLIGVAAQQDLDRTSFIPPARGTELGALDLPPTTTIAAIDDTPVKNWQEIYARLRNRSADSMVKLTFNRNDGSAPVMANLNFGQDDHDAVTNRIHFLLGLRLENETRTQRAANMGQAVMMGMDHTEKFILQVYMTLAGLFRGTVEASNLHGIVGITKVGYDVQERGPVWLWYVLAMVSVNLAVANFLPLPIVDGGLFLLLILEKIRGKPLSLKVQTAIQAVGIVLLAGLFLFVTFNDIGLFYK